MRWWEKTVEYQFVLEASQDSRCQNYLAPLDGDDERVGDAMFARDGRFTLLEFKKDFQSVDREKEKFRDYPRAKAALADRDAHHCLVFGAEDSAGFFLDCFTYFSRVKRGKVSDIFLHGLDPNQFSLYLKELTRFKDLSAEAAGGGRALDLAHYGLVVGVGTDGGARGAITLEEYRGLALGRTMERTIEKSPSLGLGKSKSQGISR